MVKYDGPASVQEFQLTLEPYEAGEITFVFVRWTALATPGGARAIRIEAKHEDSTICIGAPLATQPNNSVRHYCAFGGAPFTDTVPGLGSEIVAWIPWPQRVMTVPGARIRVFDVNARNPADILHVRVGVIGYYVA